ncbi:DUF732 domain-containing protein [Streptomyces diacarni]|uniref:DUF732 domain-containing protein n=1 Tax=Streptomyces diacarni TaxID=2800381 RepID=A0A367FDT9_9ACTN|nr:DUF732 domain-containing protein [Streptomyces diacarni]
MIATSALLTLAACGESGGDDAKEPTKSPKTASPASPAQVVSTPDAAHQKELLNGLRAVDAGLAEDRDRAVRRARSVCLDLKQKKDAATVQGKAKARFRGGPVPSLTDDQAGQVVKVVKRTVCP